MKRINKKVVIEYEGMHVMILLKEVENASIEENILEELREDEFLIDIREEDAQPCMSECKSQESSDEFGERSLSKGEKSDQYGSEQAETGDQGQDDIPQGSVGEFF